MLKLKTEKVKTSLEVPTYFANFRKEDANNYYFDIIFSLTQSDIVRYSISKIDVKICNDNFTQSEPRYDNNIPSNSNFFKSSIQKLKNLNKPSYSKKTFNELTKTQFFYDKAKDKRLTEVATYSYSNIASLVDNDTANRIKAGQALSSIEGLYKVIPSIEPMTQEEIDQIKKSASTADLDVKQYNLKILSENMIDPANVVGKNDLSIDLKNNFFVSQLRNYHLNKTPVNFATEKDSFYKKANKKVFSNKLNLSLGVTLPKSKSLQSLFLYFQVYGNLDGGKETFVIDQRDAELDVESILRYENYVRQSADVIGNNSFFITANQVDEFASSVSVFRKHINNSANSTDYELVDTKLLSYKNQVRLNVYVPPNMITVYRSQSSSQLSGTCPYIKSVVVGNPIKIDTTTMVITDNQGANSGINIKISNCPADATHFCILKTPIIGNVKRYDLQKRLNPLLPILNGGNSITDKEIQNKETYEYAVQYKIGSSAIRDSVKQVYRYLNSSYSNISVSLTNHSVTAVGGEINVSFSLQGNLKKGETDKIKSILQTTNSYEEFSDNLKYINDNFGKLTLYKVARVNLLTGEREVFEEINTDFIFNDNAATRSSYSISRLKASTPYLYEIKASVREPLSLLRDYVKQSKISVGSGLKDYYFRPYKWRNPMLLSSGMVFSQDNKGNILSPKNELFSAGEVGTVATYSIVTPSTVSSITSFTAQRIGLKKIRLSWLIDSSLSDYDHFIIVKEVNGIKNFLGPVYHQELIDDIQKDVGSFIYYITPIFSDYSAGSTVRTNCVVIDPADFNFISN